MAVTWGVPPPKIGAEHPQNGTTETILVRKGDVGGATLPPPPPPTHIQTPPTGTSPRVTSGGAVPTGAGASGYISMASMMANALP